MNLLRLPFQWRYFPFVLSVMVTALLVLMLALRPDRASVIAAPLLVSGGLALIGIRDLVQTRHSILRNYPITAHLRFLLEEIRPEMRQYFFEGEKDGMPFPRDRRAIV